MPQTLELLAPARNLECAIAAIDHGADAVYIGAVSHGARAAAGNSISDIGKICDYAHRFLAKVYVTVNTIVYDSELDAVRQLLVDLDRVGVDAVLIQDMAVVEMAAQLRREEGFRMALHASTQTDNRTPEKVAWLARQGFSRVVLARELSIAQMEEIHRQVPQVELEAFVHGALCVSYSGVCYASQHCFSRSANRGECAQFCRLKFSLVDAAGKTVDKPRYWLSLKDMCRIDLLEQMAAAGISSFKIEGRLKDAGYVKNVVAAYNQRLDRIVEHSGGKYTRQSLGKCTYTFIPDLYKTFNRGFTDYFATGKRGNIASPETPKAMGEFVGKVKEIRRDSFNVAGVKAFANGDGLCFFDSEGQLCGFRVNRAEGNRIFPQRIPQGLHPGVALYRNNDSAFEKLLSRPSAERRIPVEMTLRADQEMLSLTVVVQGCDLNVTVSRPFDSQPALKPQTENMKKQLARLGTSAYQAVGIEIGAEVANCFIPSSLLADMRREVVRLLDEKIPLYGRNKRDHANRASETTDSTSMPVPPVYREYGYMLNVANSMARSFYVRHHQVGVGKAFEVMKPSEMPEKRLLMQCKHCIRQMMGYCSREGSKAPWREPLSLKLPDGRAFTLQFDCHNCQMLVFEK